MEKKITGQHLINLYLILLTFDCISMEGALLVWKGEGGNSTRVCPLPIARQVTTFTWKIALKCTRHCR